MVDTISKPLKNKLLVKEEVEESTTSSGIILVHGKNRRDKLSRAVVLKVADNLTLKYCEGDIVIFPKYRKQSDDNIFVISHDDVLGKML